MASATPDLRLPPPCHRASPPRDRYQIILLVTKAQACEQLAQGCHPKAQSRESNPRPSESNALTTRPPGHTISPTTRLKCQFLSTVGEGLVLCVQRKSSFLQSPDWSHVANPSRCQFCRSEHHLSADQLYPELPAALQLALTQFPPLDRPKYRAHHDYPIGPGLQREVWQFLLALPA